MSFALITVFIGNSVLLTNCAKGKYPVSVSTKLHLPRSAKSLTKDRDVRLAVMEKVIAEHVSDPSVLVVEELGLEHGACRVDIAVVNGFLHGYELKSDSDTLTRLPAQIIAYSKALDRATLVVGQGHLATAKAMLPSWWGIKVATIGARGAINIHTERPISNNPDVSAFHVAHLLWRPEILNVLETAGFEKGLSKLSRPALYQLAAQNIPLSTLRSNVREILKARTDWRHLR